MVRSLGKLFEKSRDVFVEIKCEGTYDPVIHSHRLRDNRYRRTMEGAIYGQW